MNLQVGPGVVEVAAVVDGPLADGGAAVADDLVVADVDGDVAHLGLAVEDEVARLDVLEVHPLAVLDHAAGVAGLPALLAQDVRPLAQNGPVGPGGGAAAVAVRGNLLRCAAERSDGDREECDWSGCQGHNVVVEAFMIRRTQILQSGTSFVCAWESVTLS